MTWLVTDLDVMTFRILQTPSNTRRQYKVTLSLSDHFWRHSNRVSNDKYVNAQIKPPKSFFSWSRLNEWWFYSTSKLWKKFNIKELNNQNFWSTSQLRKMLIVHKICPDHVHVHKIWPDVARVAVVYWSVVNITNI